MSRIDLRALIAEAMLAPSVHNVQPARWRIEGDDRLILFEDKSVRLAVGDPRGNDAGISLGAAAEGLRLAAGRRRMSVVEDDTSLPAETPILLPVSRFALSREAKEPDPLATMVDARRSWRDKFVACTPPDRAHAAMLSSEQTVVVTDAAALGKIAKLFDEASLGFMRNEAFRSELRSWMRLSPRHPRWERDGLNAEAMAMGRIEAMAASALIGPLFLPLDMVGVAAPLLAEGKKITSAAGVIIFHRPAEEPPYVSGGHFYRVWLRIEAAGFGAAVLAALADDPVRAVQLAAIVNLPPDRRIVSAFRIGRRSASAVAPRARRTVDEILV